MFSFLLAKEVSGRLFKKVEQPYAVKWNMLWGGTIIL